MPRVLDWVGAGGVTLGARIVASVTTADVEAFRSSRSSVVRRRKWATEIVMLRRLFNFAVGRGDIPVSPMILVLLPLWNTRVRSSVPRALRAGARPQSIRTGKLTLPEVLEVEELTTELLAEGNWAERPLTRAGCPPVGEPCPFSSCRHHLALEVEAPIPGSDRPRLKLNFPGRDFDEMQETCSLRVADGPALSREETAALLNLTTERIAQLENGALEKLGLSMPADLHPA